MVTKKEREQNAQLFGLIVSVVVFAVFAVFMFIHYSRIKSKYSGAGQGQRVFDFGNLQPTLLVGAGIIVFFPLGLALLGQAKVTAYLIPFYVLFYIWMLYQFSKRIASVYYGVMADPKRGIVAFPMDLSNYGLGDYLTLKGLRDLGEMEEVALSEIDKITRQAGKVLYLHGVFGSRSIYFSRKQKRDECIAAIQKHLKAGALMVELEST